MEKIDFKNLPDTSTPLNAENLNQLQTNVENAISTVSSYSTEETIAGTWLGKPLYRKVINFGNLPSEQGTIYVNHGIENVDVFTNISIMGYEGEYTFCIPHVGNDWMFAGIWHSTRVTKTQVGIYTSGDASKQTAIVTLEYTKTTD